jgi:hypothetical protein
MRKQESAVKEFDIFSNHKGPWGFLCSVEANNENDAKLIAMREHHIFHHNQVSVYPKK